MAKLLWFLLVILTLSSISNAYRVLVVSPLPGKSHSILGYAQVKHLLDAGHEVTYITSFPKEKPHPKLQQIDVSSLAKAMPEEGMDIKNLLTNRLIGNDISYILFLMNSISRATLEHENVQKLLLDTNEQFDVVIVEWMFSDLYAGFSAVFNCPFIWFSSVEPHWIILSLIDEATNPAYTLDILSSNTPPLNFLQRVNELYLQIKGIVLREFVITKLEDKIYEDVYGLAVSQRGRNLPALEEIKYNASLVLGNSHVSMGEAIKLPQNYKPIGGYHIDTTVKPLPENLKMLMDNAKNGVIYFSMGSNLKSKDIPEELKNSLLQMFRGLKYTILWKFEEELPNLPNNVHILKWAPQQSILSHPNCILFITHGGLLSTTETIHFGVPIIGIPGFADQFINVDRAVKKGFAKRVDLSYTMANELKTAIEDVANNPSYKEKAKELSVIYHDRPVSPDRELVHWVEHVVKTGGAPHLRSPALSVPLYQKLYLDLVTVILVIVITFYISLKKLLNRSSSKKQKKVNSKKSN